MPRSARRPTAITPGQAQFILDRLLEERRISPAEIARYAADMQREIAELEARIAHLRGIAGAPPPRAVGTQSGPARSVRRDAQHRRRKGNPLAGSYMGYMRQVKGAHKKAKFKRIKADHGLTDAIAALKQYLGK